MAEKLPKVLKPEEVIRLIEGTPGATLREKRIRAVIELLYSTGIRVSELAGITYEKVDFKSSVVTVLGTLVDMLPSIAALFTIVWTAIRIYETDTIQSFLGRNKEDSDA